MAERQEILQRLDIAALLRELLPESKPSGANKLITRCPWRERHHNNDRSPSFMAFISDGEFKCLACGETGSIFDLYGKVHGLDFKDTATELARRVGLTPSVKSKHLAGFYVYHDAAGRPLYWKERVEPGSNGRSKDFYFYHGSGVEPGKAFSLPPSKRKEFSGRSSGPVLYQLPRVLAAHEIIIVEGEKQADLLMGWGFVATTLDSGSQSRLSPEMINQLSGKCVVILPDNDNAGRKYAERIATALLGSASSIKVVELPGLPEKGDILDWARTTGHDRAKLIEIVNLNDKWKAKALSRKGLLSEEGEVMKNHISCELRAFPNMYLEIANLLNDPRRHFFKEGHPPLYDSLVLHIAKSPGARFPNLARAVAKVLDTDEETAKNLVETALNKKLLCLDAEGNLIHPMVTAQYYKALDKCRVNSENGALGGKGNSPEIKKKMRRKRTLSTG